MKRISFSHLTCGLAMAALIASSSGCGGTKAANAADPVGQSDPASMNKGDDLDVPGGMNDGVDRASGQGGSGDGTAASTGSGEGAQMATGAAVTFRLKNSAKDDLVFSLDKGWQPVIFAFSGKPPNAKAILMFPKHCTAACSLSPAERCPVCDAPETVRDIKAAETREVVAAGKSLDVPWDGQVYVYEEKNCECFRKEPVPPETYTVRACGLRITKSAKSSTKYQCVEGEMAFPAEGPQLVELDFPKP